MAATSTVSSSISEKSTVASSPNSRTSPERNSWAASPCCSSVSDSSMLSSLPLLLPDTRPDGCSLCGLEEPPAPDPPRDRRRAGAPGRPWPLPLTETRSPDAFRRPLGPALPRTTPAPRHGGPAGSPRCRSTIVPWIATGPRPRACVPVSGAGCAWAAVRPVAPWPGPGLLHARGRTVRPWAR